MEDKKQKNYFIKTIIIFFIIFIIFYGSKEAGYYEYKAYTKTKLTEESIILFEKDIEEGKDVSIKDYVVNDYEDYSNPLTNIASEIGLFIENIMNNGIKKSLKILSELFYE